MPRHIKFGDNTDTLGLTICDHVLDVLLGVVAGVDARQRAGELGVELALDAEAAHV